MKKEDIESFVGTCFLDKQLGVKTQASMLVAGDAELHQPDLLYYFTGIELGAVISASNTLLDIAEKNTMTKLNSSLIGRIPDNVRLGLIFQEDKSTVEHEPTSCSKDYKFLWQYLDYIHIQVHDKNINRESLPYPYAFINQKGSFREYCYPNPKKPKEFEGFIDELVEFANSYNRDDKHIKSFDLILYPYEIAKVKNMKPTGENKLKRLVSDSIVEKLSKRKYEGNFVKIVLILHNYTANIHSAFSSDRHIYLHHLEDIKRYLITLIEEHNSKEFYNEIFFMDFSRYISQCQFDLHEL